MPAYRPFQSSNQKQEPDSLFLWSVFILLLIGAAFACWIGSFYIFGHPEKPKPYRILMRLKKLEAPRRFEVTAAPQGEFLSAKALYEKFGKSTPVDIHQTNSSLLRDYICNYRETKNRVPYLRGKFTVIECRELSGSDFFGSGVVALAESPDTPQVLIEHVYTAPPETVPLLKRMLQTGLELSIERTLDLSAVVHASRQPDGRMLFTVVPLLYGTYSIRQGSGTFGLVPPPSVNPEFLPPLFKPDLIETAKKRFAALKQAPLTDPAGAPASTAAAVPPKGPELVRLDLPENAQPPAPQSPLADPAVAPQPAANIASAAPAPEPSTQPAAVPEPDSKPDSTPTMVAAVADTKGAKSKKTTRFSASPSGTPTPVPPPKVASANPPKPAASEARPTPALQMAMANQEKSAAGRPAPKPTPSINPIVVFPAPSGVPKTAATTPPAPEPSQSLNPTASALPAPVAPAPGAPLKPFNPQGAVLASKPAPALSGSGNWQVYAPGKLPSGRSITVSEAQKLAEQGELRDRTFLKGNFVVTAAGDNKAVLRPEGSPLAAQTRIIVEFPVGAAPPRERTTLQRDDSQGFEVRDIRRGTDGQLNVYVREILSPAAR
jgi:hypothetical protein